jgi:hypothetical protein
VYASPADRSRWSRDARRDADYLFDFWTAFGWTLLTLGFYSFYVYYRLVERMREHNRRRLAFLEATNELAWARAVEQGRDDDPELRARFERVAGSLTRMRRLAGEFREPGIWLLIIVVGGVIGLMVAYWLLDVDLVGHSQAEAEAEHELAAVLAALGTHVDWPYPLPVKPPHRYGLRVLATVGTCGFYSYWWLADLMREGNDHFQWNWAWEDAAVAALA